MNAIFLTAYDRPGTLAVTLESWEKVRGIKDWAFVFRIEPSRYDRENISVARSFIERTGIEHHQIIVNPRVLGVLHHPWVGFEELFETYNFVIRAEDDLRVSDDILDYFTWAELTYRHRPEIATIHGYTDATKLNRSQSGVEILPEFNPWVWGTWRDVWHEIIGPTWDHDYSTFNHTPGHQAGWDWNLDTRIFPEKGLRGVYPKLSRVENIGVFGTHSTPDNFRTAATFQAEYGVHDYRES